VPRQQKWPRYGATSTKMSIVNDVSNKSGKSVGAITILRMVFGSVTFVIMVNI
jgi:hypothetical protein